MLMITSFANPRVAQAFVDYMATQGIILTIQQHTQSDIWLADESQAGRVQAELARFLENPADPRYLAASWQSGHTNSGLHYQRFPFLATLRQNAGPFTGACLSPASPSLSCKRSLAIGRSCCCWPGPTILR